MTRQICTHLDGARDVVPRTPDGCEECVMFEPAPSPPKNG